MNKFSAEKVAADAAEKAAAVAVAASLDNFRMYNHIARDARNEFKRGDISYDQMMSSIRKSSEAGKRHTELDHAYEAARINASRINDLYYAEAYRIASEKKAAEEAASKEKLFSFVASAAVLVASVFGSLSLFF